MNKAMVVYESMFGNTKEIASAVAEGLRTQLDVELLHVWDAPNAPDDDVDLVIVGGPTHALSMTRARTRAEAVKQGAPAVEAEVGIREWLGGLPSSDHEQQIAVFDTRAEKARHLPGSAAKAAARVARRHGFTMAAKPQSFYVSDVDGPLLAGELDRARDWGRRLASKS